MTYLVMILAFQKTFTSPRNGGESLFLWGIVKWDNFLHLNIELLIGKYLQFKFDVASSFRR